MIIGKCIYLLYVLLASQLVSSLEQGQDYYKILNLDKHKNPTDKEIRKEYLLLSKKYHPDKNNNDPDVEHKYLLVSEAYEVLSNKELKEIYDQHGQPAFQDGPGSAQQYAQQQQFRGHGGMEDIINQMFGQHFNQGPRKTQPVMVPLTLSLREFYTGISRDYNLDLRHTCEKCSGQGGQLDRCGRCQGSGRIIREFVQGHFRQQIQQPCDGCNGAGQVLKKVCGHCKGERVVRETYEIHVDVTQGSPRNTKNVYEGQGEEMPGMLRGDLIFNLEEDKNNGNYGYRRRGNNLYRTVTLTLKEALTGGWKIEIPHFSDELSPLTLKRPSNKMVSNGEIEVLKGYGMPITNPETMEFEDDYGDLIIEYNIIMPKGMSDVAKAFKLDEL
ncbi:related to DnaJ-related protein SCJ1 [Hanseniaspora guilliermondii]|uniref:Related to DnaJ-related protein SCJ1 n=1 Tax=Hanseniaspora guilliermondii TaxID=56406 RepID=A0A1L0B6R7_9ASCO|nr:related to DnaJ-related protein SCJ1 [Hanseniaspora guilliermondii]